jgi:cysteine sulfinate desulfinase/cysteine desulfurase-like protein
MNLSENSYSYVVDALGKRGQACRESSLRFTFGRLTTKQELNLTLKKIQLYNNVLQQLFYSDK